jgi:hypothetical protein
MSGEIKRLTYHRPGPITSGPDAITEYNKPSVFKRLKKSYIPVPNLHDPEPSDIYIAVEKLKKFLPAVLEKWESGQNNLFQMTLPDNWRDTISKLYKHIWINLPDSFKDKIVDRMKVFNLGNDFVSLQNPRDQLTLLNFLNQETIQEQTFNEFLVRALKTMKSETLKTIKYIALALSTEHRLYDLFPDPIIKALDESIEKHLVKPLINLKADGFDVRIEYLGKGFVGIAFLVEIDKSKFVLKLPYAPPQTKKYKHFQYEQKNLKHYEEILKKYADQNPPEQDFIPRLIYDAQGEPLSQVDKVTVTKYYQGRSLFKILSNNKTTEDYIRSGLDDDFLLDFIDFYLRFAREGADLGDITVGNNYHNGVSLVFYELAGLDPELIPRFGELKNFRQDSPVAACVFTLLTAISTLEQTKISSNYALQLRNKAKNIAPSEDFFLHRIAQLVKVFEQALKQKILDSQELKKGIVHLYDVCSSPNVSPNLKITSKGLEYLRFLKDWIEGRPMFSENQLNL